MLCVVCRMSHLCMRLQCTCRMYAMIHGVCCHHTHVYVYGYAACMACVVISHACVCVCVCIAPEEDLDNDGDPEADEGEVSSSSPNISSNISSNINSRHATACNEAVTKPVQAVTQQITRVYCMLCITIGCRLDINNTCDVCYAVYFRLHVVCCAVFSMLLLFICS